MKDLLSKFASRKLGIAGTAIGVLAAIPAVDPVTMGIKVGGIAIVASAYLIGQAMVDKEQ